MSIENYNLRSKVIPDLQSFFLNIISHFNSENYDHKTSWIPVVTNLTGTPTVTTHYQRFGSIMNFTIVMDGDSVTSSSVITNLPVSSKEYGIVTVFNKTDNSLIGQSYIDKDSTDCYLPDWSLTGKLIIIQGSYTISGI